VNFQGIAPADRNLFDLEFLRQGKGDVRHIRFRILVFPPFSRQCGNSEFLIFLSLSTMKSFRLFRIALPLLLVSLIWLSRDSTEPSSGVAKNPDRKVPIGENRREDPSVIFSKAPREFAGWLEEYRNEPETVDLEKGVSLARARRVVLKRMIELDPERALTLAILDKERGGLPEEIVALLETSISTAGKFERVVSCYLGGLERPPDAPTEERFVSFDEKRFRAFTYGRRAELLTKDRISVHGMTLDEVLAFSPDPVKKIAGGAELLVEAFGEEKRFANEDDLDLYVAMLVADENALGPSGNSLEAESPWTEGNKRILYLRVRFADDDPTYEPVTLATAQSDQDDVAEHYRIASYGKLNVTTVFPDMITLTENKSEYVGQGLGTMMNEARAAAIVLGDTEGVDWDYKNFDLYTIISDGGIGPYAGIAQVGGRKSHHQRGYTSLRTSGHEFGHNLGLSHAHFNYSNDLNPRGSTPTDGLGRVEYGHRFSLMSGQSGSDMSNPTLPHFTVHEKWRLDWIANSDFTDITNSGQNGTYRLFQNDDENATGLRALRLPSGGALSRYWLSYRTAWRQPNRSSDNDYLLNGILFNWTGSGGGSSTLLDMTPYSDQGSTGGAFWTRDNSDKWDAPLLIGRTYTDAESKVSVTPIARGGSAPDEYIDLFVHLATGSEVNLVAEDDGCRAVIPDALTATGTDWTANGFDDSAWPLSGPLGVGYDTGSDYNPYFGVDVIAMRSNNESCYIRVPFTIDEEINLTDIESLTLKMRYDDGFVAYLNGVKIAEDRAPVSPGWNSGATSNHDDGAAVGFLDFSANAGLGALVAGENVLSIHGLNSGTRSSDFLMQPVLTATLSAPANGGPSVSLAADALVVAVNQDVTLTVTASDPEGDTLAYAWDFDIGDAYAPEGQNEAVAVRRWSSPGLYVVTVTVSDRRGGIARARVLVKVGSASNEGVIRGRVLQGGQPVAGARVFVEGSDRQSITLEDGSYIMSGLSISSSTVLGAMFDGDVFRSVVTMPLTPNPELRGVDFFGHAPAPAGAPVEAMTLSPHRASTDTASTVQLVAQVWDNAIAEDGLIPFGDTWSYLDTGVDPGAAWNTAAFDDGAWLSGSAELGYGDSQATVVSFGADSNAKHITTWFRRTFTATNVGEVSRLKLSVKRDDGVRVFLNGTEIARDNLTTGAVSAGTKASNDVTSSNEEILIQFNVDPALLIGGNNILAAEIHLEDDDSSDLSFDLELSAARSVSTVAPTWSVSPGGASVSPEGVFSATSPGSYTVTAMAGALSAEATILVATDNVVTIVALDEFLWENGGGAATVRVTRVGATDAEMIVPLSVAGNATSGSDFSGVPTSVTIPVGQVSVEFMVTVLDDSDLEGRELISVTPAGGGSFEVGSPALASVTIVDDESAQEELPRAGTDTVVTVNEALTLAASTFQQEKFVVAGDYWKFDDNGAEAAAGWRGLPFDDGNWGEGLAKFGYGDGDETTTVSFGGTSSGKHITTYFRRRFYLDNPLDYSALTARVLVDDGAVIYVNGVEAQRINMPAGAIAFSTRANGAVGGGDEETFFEWVLDSADLVAGENIIVVEVHQSSATSSDLGFDLTLSGTLVSPPLAGGVKWSQQSGPGTATFSDDASLTSSVNFDQAGTYLLQMEALDSGVTDEVTITVEPGQSFLQWMGRYLVGESGPLADPDQDALVNLMEYALGGDPSGAVSDVRPTLVKDAGIAGDLLFSYRRLRELNSGDGSGKTGEGYSIYGINYTVQATEILGSWGAASSALAMQVEGVPSDNGDGTETVTLRLTPPNPADTRWFVRLRVVED
jgi:hypothetical protein